MATTDTAQRLEAEDLARARNMTQTILEDWNLITWNELLAEDVTLTLRMGAVGMDKVGDIAAVGGNLEVEGREDAKRVLKSIYGAIKKGLYVTTEVVSGYEVALLGNMALTSTTEGATGRSFPIVIYMKFNSEGKVSDMTISAVDLQPLTQAIRNAAKTGSAAKAK
jgi:hypothetical protein